MHNGMHLWAMDMHNGMHLCFDCIQDSYIRASGALPLKWFPLALEWSDSDVMCVSHMRVHVGEVCALLLHCAAGGTFKSLQSGRWCAQLQVAICGTVRATQSTCGLCCR
jgi:hypothetical protein